MWFLGGGYGGYGGYGAPAAYGGYGGYGGYGVAKAAYAAPAVAYGGMYMMSSKKEKKCENKTCNHKHYMNHYIYLIHSNLYFRFIQLSLSAYIFKPFFVFLLF